MKAANHETGSVSMTRAISERTRTVLRIEKSCRSGKEP